MDFLNRLLQFKPPKSGSGQPVGSKKPSPSVKEDHETYVQFAREFVEEIVENVPQNSGSQPTHSVEHLETDNSSRHSLAFSDCSLVSHDSAETSLSDHLRSESVVKKHDTDSDTGDYESAIESDARDYSTSNDSFISEENIANTPNDDIESFKEDTLIYNNSKSHITWQSSNFQTIQATLSPNSDLDSPENNVLIANTSVNVYEQESSKDIDDICFNINKLHLETPIKLQTNTVVECSPGVLVTVNYNLDESSEEHIEPSAQEESIVITEQSLQELVREDIVVPVTFTEGVVKPEQSVQEEHIEPLALEDSIVITEQSIQELVKEDIVVPVTVTEEVVKLEQSVQENHIEALALEDSIVITEQSIQELVKEDIVVPVTFTEEVVKPEQSVQEEHIEPSAQAEGIVITELSIQELVKEDTVVPVTFTEEVVKLEQSVQEEYIEPSAQAEGIVITEQSIQELVKEDVVPVTFTEEVVKLEQSVQEEYIEPSAEEERIAITEQSIRELVKEDIVVPVTFTEEVVKLEQSVQEEHIEPLALEDSIVITEKASLEPIEIVSLSSKDFVDPSAFVGAITVEPVCVPSKEVNILDLSFEALLDIPVKQSLQLSKVSDLLSPITRSSLVDYNSSSNRASINNLIELCMQQQKQLEQRDDPIDIKSHLREKRFSSSILEDRLAAEAAKISIDIHNTSNELDERDHFCRADNITIVGTMSDKQSAQTVDEHANSVPLDVKWLSESRKSPATKCNNASNDYNNLLPSPRTKMSSLSHSRDSIGNYNQEDFSNDQLGEVDKGAGGDSEATDNQNASLQRSINNDMQTSTLNQSEAGPEIADQNHAGSQEIFTGSADFDFLSKMTSSQQTTDRLRFQSLYVKFDPLVSAAPISKTTDNSIPLPPLFNDSNRRSADGLDQSSAIPQSPPQNPAIAYVDRLISLSPSPKKVQPSPPPMKKEPVVSPLAIEEHDTKNEELLILRELILVQDKCQLQAKEAQQSLQIQFDRVQLCLKEAHANEQKLTKKVAEMSQSQQEMNIIMEEYEKTISRLVAEKEHDRQSFQTERQNIIKEKDTALVHLNNIEVAFSDVHQKYERSKTVIGDFKKNEDILRDTVANYEATIHKSEQKYDMLKSHAMAQLESANQELEGQKKKYEIDIAKLRAMLKKTELKTHSLEEVLEQKRKENEELVNICDDLINKVGS